MGAGIGVNVLGSVTIAADDGLRPVAGAKARSALARLAAEAGSIVPRDLLIDALWPRTAPKKPADVVRVHLSGLRRQLREAGGQDLIVARADGWMLDLPPDSIDLVRFSRHVIAGRRELDQQSWDRATSQFDLALGMWRGRPFSDVDECEFFDRTATHLELLREDAIRGSIDAGLHLGQGASLLPLLERRAAANPFDESAAAAHSRALYQSGRSAEALDVVRAANAALAGRGLVPGPSLEALERQILLHAATQGCQLRADHTPVPTQMFHRDGSGSSPNTRPSVANALLGRDSELADALALVDRHRAVGIIGLGGIGKTRLSQAVLEQLDRPTWFLELEQLTSSFQLIGAIAACAGLNAAGSTETLFTRIVAELRRTSAVVVFDACEHLVDEVAAVAARMLAETPQNRLLFTSRVPIPIQGIRSITLGPLTTGTATDPGPAAQIVTDSAGMGCGDITEHWDRVAAACSASGGIPLALELSGRAIDLSTQPAAVAGHTIDGADPIARAVESAIRDMPPSFIEQLSLLSLLPDGFSTDFAALLLGHDPRETRHLLETAHQRGLLVVDHRRSSPRFRPLEPVRVQLRDQRPPVERRRAEATAIDILLDLARSAAPSWMEPVDRTLALRLDAERNNVLALIESPTTGADRFVDAAVLIPRSWRQSARVAEAQRLATSGLERARDLSPLRRAELLLGIASASPSLANRLEYVTELEEALRLAREAGADDVEMRAMAELTIARGWMGDLAGAVELLAELDRRVDHRSHPWARSAVASLHALATGVAGDPRAGAELLVTEAHTYEANGLVEESMANLSMAGSLFRVAGDDEAALGVLKLASEHELTRFTAYSRAHVAFEMARIATERSSPDAGEQLRAASGLLDQYGDHRTALVCRRDLGRWLADNEQCDEARSILRVIVPQLLPLDQRAAAVALGVLASIHIHDPRTASLMAAAATGRVDGTGAPLDAMEQRVIDSVAHLALLSPCPEISNQQILDLLELPDVLVGTVSAGALRLCDSSEQRTQ